MSFNEWMVKQKAVYPHHETLPSNEQEQTIDTYIPWLNLQGIMNGKSNPKRLHIMPLMRHSWNDKIIGMENRLLVGSSFKERARVRRIKEWRDIFVVVMEMPCAFTGWMPMSWWWWCSRALQDVTTGRNWVKGTREPLCMRSHNCIWIDNYRKMKSLNAFVKKKRQITN